ncbi:MAG: nucleoside 2-deoxyribosyltransferase [Candidatus Pacebacteria bacterium]|jgi:nucleoside 2-deoxyribosyltransferase|nr:nucleoside 2-deoxyribosyltransferase [Candidatus Paceibacterota bacterium]
MKIYFAGSIRGGRDDAALYAEIIKLLANYGEVLTEHIGLKDLSSLGEERTPQDIYERDMDWLLGADVLVAEVTTTSLGVGYEIGEAVAVGKRIMCLYREQEGKKLSAMIDGNPELKVVRYEEVKELKNVFDSFFNK